jgi:coenzyme PQQ biosynthesis protein PqqD
MSAYLVRNPRLAWREVDGEIVIVSPEDSRMHELNETASLVWRQADGTLTADEIAEHLAAEFEVELEVARADVAELMAALGEQRLLLDREAVKE